MKILFLRFTYIPLLHPETCVSFLSLFRPLNFYQLRVILLVVYVDLVSVICCFCVLQVNVYGFMLFWLVLFAFALVVWSVSGVAVVWGVVLSLMFVGLFCVFLFQLFDGWWCLWVVGICLVRVCSLLVLTWDWVAEDLWPFWCGSISIPERVSRFQKPERVGCY